MILPLYNSLAPLTLNRVFAAAPAYDPDAQAYIDAVELEDGQALEVGVKDAINDFVVGCKSDGIWSAIKASCILAGARTLDGALVPLVGAAPTNNNFVSGDYNRETGLLGNGSTKYLDSNRNNNADPQNNNHNAVYISNSATSSVYILMGSGASASVGENNITYSSFVGGSVVDSRSGVSDFKLVQAGHWSDFSGHTRSSGTTVVARASGTTVTLLQNSNSPLSGNVFVFARNTGAAASNARLSFYSIGEALDLADLDTRVSTLMTDLASAI